MTRWFTTLLYALMLACAALPVQAAAMANVAVAGVAGVAADSQDTGDHSALSVEPADASSSSSDNGTPEVPELFFEALPHLVLPMQSAEVPPSIAVPLSPHPFLKGPQRPPRAVTLPLAAC